MLNEPNIFFQFGEFIVYFFDYTIGCGWWMMVLYVLMLSAMFIIRGKPYSGENICTVLISPMANCIANILTSTLAFCWNVVSYGCIITNLKCFNVFKYKTKQLPLHLKIQNLLIF